MPVAIIPSQHRLLANRASKTPYSEIVQAWYAPMSADTRAAYSKDLELWARSMKASLAELAALCIESPQDAYKTAILAQAGEPSIVGGPYGGLPRGLVHSQDQAA